MAGRRNDFVTPLDPNRPITAAHAVSSCTLVVSEPAEVERGLSFSGERANALAAVSLG